MAKTFNNLNKNRNTNSVLDDITKMDKPNKKIGVEGSEFKSYPLKLPVEVHKKLKFELAQKFDMTLQELIMNAIEQTYSDDL